MRCGARAMLPARRAALSARAGRHLAGRPGGRRPRAPGHRCAGRRPDRPRHAHRDDGGERRGRRVRDRGARRDDLLQHVRGPGPRPRGAVPDHHDGTVRRARAVHRAGPGPDSAGPAVRAGRHDADPRPALLRHVRERGQLGDAAARRVRHPGAAEGGRRRQGLGHAAPAARRDHARHRQRAVRTDIDRHLHGGGRPRRRRADRGRRGLDAARRHPDLPGRDDPRVPAARADRRPRRGGPRAHARARPRAADPAGHAAPDPAGHAAPDAAAAARRAAFRAGRPRLSGGPPRGVRDAGARSPASAPSSPRR